MRRTYWIKYKNVYGEQKFDKVVWTSPEDRPSWHKVEALSDWKESHKGYGHLRITSVFTKAEMKENGYM